MHQRLIGAAPFSTVFDRVRERPGVWYRQLFESHPLPALGAGSVAAHKQSMFKDKKLDLQMIPVALESRFPQRSGHPGGLRRKSPIPSAGPGSRQRIG